MTYWGLEYSNEISREGTNSSFLLVNLMFSLFLRTALNNEFFVSAEPFLNTAYMCSTYQGDAVYSDHHYWVVLGLIFTRMLTD